ncbi:hypothetical protein M9H77_30787 [Catharanthus roseus]|uniref:Uncharacterized protein n=1 Tax=Catharanthus roseus TaxID=4058 RepID=A0ACC0A032_CATRO|nr:hypothetical protein M9H77_30787 [Catharanthus roseus]
MAEEQPIRPRKSLALGQYDCTLSPLAWTTYPSLGSSSIVTSSATLGTLIFSEKYCLYQLWKKFGTEVLSIDAHPVHHFIDELSLIDVLLPVPIRSSINLSMEDINERIEEGFKGEHHVKEKGSSGQGVYANLSKEFGNPESLAYGQVYVLTGDEGAIWLEAKRLNSNLMKMPYRALFRVLFGKWLVTTNVTAVPKERAHLLYALATRKRINIYNVIFRNILRKIGQKKASKIAFPCPHLISGYLLSCRGLSLPSDSWVRTLDPLVMPKIVAVSVVPPFQLHPHKDTRAQAGLPSSTLVSRTIASRDRSCAAVQQCGRLEEFKIKQLVPRGSLEELKGFNCAVCKWSLH